MVITVSIAEQGKVQRLVPVYTKLCIKYYSTQEPISPEKVAWVLFLSGEIVVNLIQLIEIMRR